MKLSVKVQKKKDGSIVILPSGSITSENARLLDDKLSEALKKVKKGIILDMKGVDYIDSTGLSIIIRAKQVLELKGSPLVITQLQPDVKRIFNVIKAIPETFFATLKEADEYLDNYIMSIKKKAGGK